MANLSEIQRIELLIIVGFQDCRRIHSEACHVINDSHASRPPIGRSTVSRTVQRFNELKKCKKSSYLERLKTATTNDVSLQFLLDVRETSQFLIKERTADHDISEGSIRRILKQAKYHPYKPHPLHELVEDDFDCRKIAADGGKLRKR